VKVLFPLWSNEGEGRSIQYKGTGAGNVSDMIGVPLHVKCQSSNGKLSAQTATLPGNEVSFTLCRSAPPARWGLSMHLPANSNPKFNPSTGSGWCYENGYRRKKSW
jgi:hypothetical protein